MVAAMANTTAEDLDNELEIIFIEETFHKSQPIRAKPLQTHIPRVVIKNRRKKVKDINGVLIKVEPEPKKLLTDRFQEFVVIRQSVGIVFDEDDDDDEDYTDEEDDGMMEENILSTATGLSRPTKNKLSINLAKKLKNRAIANRLGVQYNPSKRLKKLKPRRQQKPQTWAEKFGRLLAAKKLLYLPLLYRKYNTGPKMTKDELDIEIDLYMAEVREAKKMKLAYGQVTAAAASGFTETVENGLRIVKPNLSGGFGGPGWRKRVTVEEKKPDRNELDMELDTYMANKGNGLVNGTAKGIASEEALDLELEEYMAAVKKKTNAAVLVN